MPGLVAHLIVTTPRGSPVSHSNLFVSPKSLTDPKKEVDITWGGVMARVVLYPPYTHVCTPAYTPAHTPAHTFTYICPTCTHTHTNPSRDQTAWIFLLGQGLGNSWKAELRRNQLAPRGRWRLQWFCSHTQAVLVSGLRLNSSRHLWWHEPQASSSDEEMHTYRKFHTLRCHSALKAKI